MRHTWMAPLTGVLSFALLLVWLAIAEYPPVVTDVPIGEVVDFYVDNEDAVFIGSVLQTLFAGLFLLFAAQLSKAMRKAGADSSAIGLIAGAAVFTAGTTLDATINAAAASSAGDVDPVAVQALAALYELDYMVAAVGMFVFLVSWGAGIVRHGVFPKWTGWILAIGGLVAVTPAWFVALVFGALAVLVASVMLTMREREAAA